MPTDYEKQRQENIARNKALLASLGLENPLGEFVVEKRPGTKVPAAKAKAKPSLSKKRKASEDEYDSEAEAQSAKVPRTSRASVITSESGDSPGPRRSQRNAGKTVDYKSEKVDTASLLVAVSSGVRTVENDGPMGRESGKRMHDPKRIGSIPGVAVGTWWDTREGCSLDAIHAPWVGGISGNKSVGAYSIALSGGYEDDVDLGSTFTYTGSGGRDLKGTKANPKNLRTAPQTKDQSFDGNHFNAALKKSSETKKAIRVIRGFKLKSPYAPAEGYRYDGLYRIEKAWMDRGLEGFLVCRFAFKRLDGQPPLPYRDLDAEKAESETKRETRSRTRGMKEETDEEDTDQDEAKAEEVDGEVADDGVEGSAGLTTRDENTKASKGKPRRAKRCKDED